VNAQDRVRAAGAQPLWCPDPVEPSSPIQIDGTAILDKPGEILVVAFRDERLVSMLTMDPDTARGYAEQILAAVKASAS
jgi:hypothetical protein